jgi:hypothetical protein
MSIVVARLSDWNGSFDLSMPQNTGVSFSLGYQRTEAFMESSMDRFVEGGNIAHFTTLLMTETDTAKRELLQKLLTDEMLRQAGHSDAKPIGHKLNS